MLIASMVVLTTALSMYGFVTRLQRTHQDIPRRNVGRMLVRSTMLELGRQIFVDASAPATDDVRIVAGVRIAGVDQSVLTYRLVRGYAAPLAGPGADWSVIGQARGVEVSGVVYLVQRAPMQATGGGPPRYLNSRLLRLEVPADRGVAMGLVGATLHSMNSPALSTYLSRPEVWRASDELASDVSAVTFADQQGLSCVVQLYDGGD